MLYRSYEQTSIDREDTSQDAFAHAVASLMQRYREGRQIDGYQVQMMDYWTTLDSLMTAISFRVATERLPAPSTLMQQRQATFHRSLKTEPLAQHMTHTCANGLGRHTHTLSIHQKTCRRQSDGLWHQQSKMTCQVSQSSHYRSLRGARHHTNSSCIIQWYIALLALQPYLVGPFNSRCPQHGTTARISEHIQSMAYWSLQWSTHAGLIGILMRGSSVRDCKK